MLFNFYVKRTVHRQDSGVKFNLAYHNGAPVADILNDLFICTIYIPLENSNYFEDDILPNIHNDMLHFQDENFTFIMVGDFSARTSNLPDFNNESGNEFINIQSLNSQITTEQNNFDGEEKNMVTDSLIVVNQHNYKL